MNRQFESKPVTDRLADLGESVRLRILKLLEAQELSVGEVARVVQLPQSTVSRHLKVLSDGGWLAKRSRGTATFYRLVLDDLSLHARALWLTVREQMGIAGEVAEDARRLAGVLAERRLDSEAFFGRVAGEWDDVRNDLFGDRFMAPALLSFLPREWVVADLGCGTGNVSELLAPCVARVIAVDSSPVMLEAARRRLAGIKNVEFVEGDVARLPLADRSTDAAVIALVLHHLEQPETALREVWRVVRPGGRVLVVDMVGHDRTEYRHSMGHKHLGFEAGAIKGLFDGGGFDRAQVRELAGDPTSRGPGLFVATALRP